MSPEDPTVDEATPESLQATQQAGPADEVEQPEGEAATADAAAEPADEDAPLTPAEAYRQALDRYLAGELTEALRIVDEVLSSDEETELRPRLERLRRRAEDRIGKEGGSAEPAAEEPKAEGQLIQAPSKEKEAEPAAEAEASEAEAASETEEASEPSSDEAPALTKLTEAAEVDPKVQNGLPAADAEAATETEEAKAEGSDVDQVEAEAKPEARPDSGRERRTSESGRLTSESGRQKAARPPGGPKQQRRPGPPGRGPQARPKQPGRRPGAPPVPPVIHKELDRIGGTLETLGKAVRGVENHTLKVAEAYQRISQHHKRKEQAYDQLYEELRQYKENFLLQAQKPLFKDIILLFDGVNRSHKTLTESEEEEFSKERALEMLAHIRDEILEVLYRRDIEPIEEYPDVLDIELQKPVQRIDTDDPSKDRQIAQVIREGFRMAGAILRPQEVVVLRCTKTEERES